MPIIIAGAAYYQRGEFDRAIENFTKAIELNSNYAAAYNNRGTVQLQLREWEEAKSDLTVARAMGINIIAMFLNDYASVSDFERRHRIKLPEELAEMLTPQQ